jgi:hypothetical protein
VLLRKKRHAFKERYSGASQKNTVNYFFLSRSKPITVCCVGDILSEKRNGRMKHNTKTGMNFAQKK